MLLLYAVVQADWTPPPTGGAAGLSMLSGPSVAVLYDERDEMPSTSREEVLGFGKVVTEVAQRGPALPVRFGTVVQTVEELRGLLEERAEDWDKRLSVVRGHVELLVHVVDEAAPAKTPASRGSGRDYLLSRAGAHRHIEELFQDLSSAVAAHCREVRRLPGSDELRVACLVPAGGVDDLRAALDTWAEHREGLRSRTTGPWPPFSFTEEDELS
ncbi:MAG TPA: GvpL/GvpF family gas vesicle protein [Nocardioidaceae bacterium]|nr:GvpL/GvpF family gas vesicle protein [Nocardioidaceae bacterium]